MTRLFWLSLMAFLVILSCKKDDDNTSTVVSAGEFLPMTVGNYWVYSNVVVDTLGAETIQMPNDSITFTKDTVVNGLTYFKLEGISKFTVSSTWSTLGFFRDSSGFLVDLDGKTIFSNVNFSEVLNFTAIPDNPGQDTMFTLEYQMVDAPNPVTVPAGTFDVLDYQGKLTYLQTNSPVADNPRISHDYFAEGVGKVKQTFFFASSPDSYEKRLISYLVQ